MFMSVIDSLRREGDVLHAYEMAKIRLAKKPDQELVKKDLARVLTDLLQKHCLLDNKEQFFAYLDEFYELDIPARDSVIHENIMWQVGKFIKELTRSEAPSEVFDNLFAKIAHVQLPPKTSLFTFITSSALESKEYNTSYLNLLIHQRLRHLPPNHFEAINEDGEKKPSLGEQILLTIAKVLTAKDSPNKSDIKILLEELDFVEVHYPNIPYTAYYRAKAHDASGNKQDAELAILEYIRKRSKEYLGWELLADIVNDPIRKMRALSKAIICHTRAGQLLRPQMKLYHMFLNEQQYDIAKALYYTINDTKRELGKGITDEWKSHQKLEWFKKNKKSVNVQTYCYRFSKPLVREVFKDWTSQTGIIYGINSDKDLAEFIVSDDVHGAFKLFGDKRIKVGGFVDLKLQRVANHQGVKYKALNVDNTEKRPKRSIYKVVEDQIRKEDNLHLVASVPINMEFAQKRGHELGDTVRVTAVKLPSSRMNESAKWKVLSISKKASS